MGGASGPLRVHLLPGRAPQTESDNSVTLVLCIRRHSALLSVPLYETAALGQGEIKRLFQQVTGNMTGNV